VGVPRPKCKRLQRLNKTAVWLAIWGPSADCCRLDPEYLQHGGGDCCRENDVTITPVFNLSIWFFFAKQSTMPV